MSEQRREYLVEPMFLSPDELRNQRFKIDDTFNELAEDGWVYEDAVRIDSSTFLFVFSRPVES